MKKYLAVFGKPRYLGIFATEEEIKKGDSVLVESVRGFDIAVCVGLLTEEQEAEYRAMRNTIDRGENSPKTVEPTVTELKYLKRATDAELDEQRGFRREEAEILKKAKELVVPHDLDMKLIDVEYLMGKLKLFVYFSAEQRVDFRAYVRDLAHEFRTRIELRQVGIRDEAKIAGGIGMCGNICCCKSWLHQFAPVGIKMVKEQNLALNPAKISGVCGRLMCCMCYEESVYRELWEGLPTPGTKIKSANGNVVVTGMNIGKKALRCFIPDHGEKDVPIEKFEAFRDAVLAEKEWEELEQLILGEEVRKKSEIFDMLPQFNANLLSKTGVHRQAKTDIKQQEESAAKHTPGKGSKVFHRENQGKNAGNAKPARGQKANHRANVPSAAQSHGHAEQPQAEKQRPQPHRFQRRHRIERRQKNGGEE